MEGSNVVRAKDDNLTDVGTVGAAYKAAEMKKAERATAKKKDGLKGLLLDYKIEEETPDEARIREERVRERQQDTQALADKIRKAKDRLAKIENTPGWETDPDSVKKRNEIQTFLEKVKAEEEKDQVLRDSLKVTEFIKKISQVMPCETRDVAYWLEHVAEIGRGKLDDAEAVKEKNSGKLPEGAVVFEKKALCHIKSEIYPNDMASPTDKKIFL